MEQNSSADKSSPMREFRFSVRSGRNKKAIVSVADIMEAIVKFRGDEMAAAEGGRLKIVVKKDELKHVLEAIRDGRRRAPVSATATSLALEQRLNLMRRRQIARAGSSCQSKGRSLRHWTPALQSIPEET